MIGLFTRQLKPWLEGGQSGVKRLPWVFHGQQQHTVAKVFDDHFSACKAVFLGQPNGAVSMTCS
jgi:hypothetical protein